MMEENKRTLEEVIKTRKSTRNFSSEFPSVEVVEKILAAGIYAPFGGATGIPLNEIRKIFVFEQNTESMTKAREILYAQAKKNATKIKRVMFWLPFMRSKFKLFSGKVNAIATKGIPALTTAPYFIVLAEKKGFPPIEKESMAHAFENMWLMATELGLGFQLISATGTLSDNKQFLEFLELKKGEYALGGCAIGIPKNTAKKDSKELDTDKFITWIK